jgi:hypothetical protein
VVHERHFDVIHLWELGYTAGQLARVIPEEVVMASSLFDKAIEKRRLEDARHLCMEFVKRHHPGVAAPLLVLELPAPLDEVARGHLHRGGHPLLRLGHEAAHVAAPHVRLDDQPALAALVVDRLR